MDSYMSQTPLSFDKQVQEELPHRFRQATVQQLAAGTGVEAKQTTSQQHVLVPVRRPDGDVELQDAGQVLFCDLTSHDFACQAVLALQIASRTSSEACAAGAGEGSAIVVDDTVVVFGEQFSCCQQPQRLSGGNRPIVSSINQCAMHNTQQLTSS
jgi:hypothetical protein